jgi:hypothetical protein
MQLSTLRQMGAFPKHAQMSLRDSRGDENGHLAMTTQIISCPASAIF